jgi:hypothetical protein
MFSILMGNSVPCIHNVINGQKNNFGSNWQHCRLQNPTPYALVGKSGGYGKSSDDPSSLWLCNPPIAIYR